MHGGSGTSTSFKKRYSQLSVLSEAQKREHMIRCVCARACLSVCARALPPLTAQRPCPETNPTPQTLRLTP
jgi:hypothetical protein